MSVCHPDRIARIVSYDFLVIKPQSRIYSADRPSED